jgi:acyl-CoA thioester hydrolase
MGVVHNAVYAVYCEIGRTVLCEAHGLPYHEMERTGLFMMVAEMGGRFLRAIRYGDRIEVRVRISKVRRKLVCFEYEIVHAGSGDLCYTGFSKHLFSRDRMKTCTLPEDYLSAFQSIAESPMP